MAKQQVQSAADRRATAPFIAVDVPLAHHAVMSFLHPFRRNAAAAALAVLAAACAPSETPLHRIAGEAQGTTYSLQWTGGNADIAAIAAAAERELERIDELLSNYRPDSAIEQLNGAKSVDPQAVPPELVRLIQIAKTVHQASDGCFDPTVRPLVAVWGFDTDEPSIPEAGALERAAANVGLDKLVVLDAEHVRKSVPGVEIDMASIGQGYTAERLATVLEEQGITSYLVEIGGELVARGAKPGGQHWRVGVENPSPSGRAGPSLSLPTEGRVAAVTSGSYRHYFEVDGRRFGHIIDPRTGWPVEHSLVAVTVVGHDGAWAAAWGTALLCMGPAPAATAAEREGLAALFWTRDPDAESARLQASAAFGTEEWRGVLEQPAVH